MLSDFEARHQGCHLFLLSHLSRRLSITGRDRHCIILRHFILFFGWFMIPLLLILTLLHFHAFSYTSCEQYKKWLYKSQFPSKSIKKKKKLFSHWAVKKPQCAALFSDCCLIDYVSWQPHEVGFIISVLQIRRLRLTEFN